MTKVTLYRGYSGSRNVLNELPSFYHKLDCRFEKLTSNLSHIIIDKPCDDINTFNYVKIDSELINKDRDEYYFIDSLEFLTQNKVKFNLSLDYLQTFKDHNLSYMVSAVNKENDNNEYLEMSYKLVGNCVETPLNTDIPYDETGHLSKEDYDFVKKHFRTYLVICNDYLRNIDGVRVYYHFNLPNAFVETSHDSFIGEDFRKNNVKGRFYYLFNVYHEYNSEDIIYDEWGGKFYYNKDKEMTGSVSEHQKNVIGFNEMISKFMISGNANNIVERVVSLDGLGSFSKGTDTTKYRFNGLIKKADKTRVIITNEGNTVPLAGRETVFGIMFHTDVIEQNLGSYFFDILEIKGNKPAVKVLKYKDLEIPLKKPYYTDSYNNDYEHRTIFDYFNNYGSFKRTIFLQPNPKEKITIQYFNYDREEVGYKNIIENNIEEYWTDVNYDFAISSSVIDSHLSVNEKMYNLEKQKMDREMNTSLEQIKRDRITNSIGLGLDIGSSLLSIGSAISGNVVAMGQIGSSIGGVANSVLGRVNQYENIKRKESDIHYEREYQKEKREIELDNLRRQGNIIKGDTYETDEMSCYRPVLVTVHLANNNIYSTRYPLYELSQEYEKVGTIQSLLDEYNGFKGRIINGASIGNRYDINELNDILKMGVHKYNEKDRTY